MVVAGWVAAGPWRRQHQPGAANEQLGYDQVGEGRAICKKGSSELVAR